MRVQVADLHPNPFRRLDRYPVDRGKIDALKQSIKDTTFWDNLLVRPNQNGKGGYEIAYGHNRVEALRELRIKEIDIPVRDLDNNHMAQIMSHENMQEWGHSSSIEQETVRAVVEAYADGRITLPSVAPRQDNASVRLAPYFRQNRDADGLSSRTDHPYTVETLAQFLGWKEYKVQTALNALALIDEGLASDKTFEGLSTKQAQTVVQQAKRALAETGDKKAAKSVAKQLAAGMQKATEGKAADGSDRQLQEVTIHNAKKVTDDLLGIKYRKPKKTKKVPDITKFAEGVRVKLDKLVPDIRPKMDAIITYRAEESFDRHVRTQLVKTLRRLAKDIISFADRLEA
jgi:hypothetical protein